MKHKFSLILFSALLSTTFAWAQDASFYNLPKGAFGCGMTTTGVLADPYIVAPYFPDESPVWTSTTGAGKWTVGSDIVEESSDTYTMEVSMKGKYNIPVLVQEGKKKFQFGIKKNEEVREDSYFYVGDPEARYITPALMYTDLKSKTSGQAHALIDNYNTKTNDVMGVYFNNEDVIYIDGISIPIKNGDATSATGMFPDDAHVIVNIYKATNIGGKENNQADKTKPLWTGTLTINQYSDQSSNTGALNVTFGQNGFQGPISIDGPFVVELSDMNKSGCNFGVYSSNVHSGANEWGYYIKDGVETYPGNYCLAVSVHAMFPVLYGEANESLDVTVPSTGSKMTDSKCPTRTVYANYKYATNQNGWSRTASKTGVITMSFLTADQTDESTEWYFIMSENDANTKREVDVTFKFRGKELTYHVTQAPMITDIYFQESLSLKKDETSSSPLYLDVAPNSADKKEITLSSINPDIATIDEDGKVTAHSHGIATITATYGDITKTCTVTVFGVEPIEDPTTTTIIAPAAGDNTTTVSFTLAAGLEFDKNNWSVFKNDKPEWITGANFTSSQTDPEGPTTVTCTLTAAANATGSKRDGEVTITAFTDKFTYSISQESSAFYKLPEGAFGSGMTEKGGLLPPFIVAPYIHGKPYEWKSTTGVGKWTVDSEIVEESSETYTMDVSMKEKYNIPVFEQEGNKKFQFGIKENEGVRMNSYFYVGDPTPRYITPALLYTDLASNLKGQSLFSLPLQNVMGVYFNNKDVMYIDSISIPIIYNKSPNETDDDFFPQDDSHIDVKIYHAKIEGETKQKDIDKPAIWTGTLTKIAFSPYDEERNRGALNATFDPIPIEGPFVVELSGMKESSCAFRIFASKERSDCNKWGYCLDDDGDETYPDYTPAISVHAMFPALYPKAYTDTVIYIPGEGVGGSSGNDRPKRTVFANYKWTKDKNGWMRTETSGITMNYETATLSADSTVWMFAMGENTTTAERHAYVTFTFRGKSLTYHLIQLPNPYTRDVTDGNWGTICLPWASTSLEGATFYNVLGTKDATQGIALEPITELEAGKPYVFYATSNKIKVTYKSKGTPKDAPVYADNQIIGTFTNNTEVPSGKYIIYDNKLYKAGTGVTIDEYRAYFDVDNMEAYNPATAPARVVFFGGSQSPTDINTLPYEGKAGKGSFKVLKDGQLLIIRDGKTYNAQGIEL